MNREQAKAVLQRRRPGRSPHENAVEAYLEIIVAALGYSEVDEPEPHEHRDWRTRARNREAP